MIEVTLKLTNEDTRALRKLAADMLGYNFEDDYDEAKILHPATLARAAMRAGIYWGLEDKGHEMILPALQEDFESTPW